MPYIEAIEPRWSGTCIVAASGPSLTAEVAERCRSVSNCLCVSDAYKLLPWAPVMYAADWKWWKQHDGCPGFAGEKWIPKSSALTGEAKKQAEKYGLMVIPGERKGRFSTDPTRIHFGEPGTGNSGFQAVNIAILFGATRIILVGFDMRQVDGRRHFFGSHPKALNQNQSFGGWVRGFKEASQSLTSGVSIINATPNSALKCFPMMSLAEAVECSRAA